MIFDMVFTMMEDRIKTWLGDAISFIFSLINSISDGFWSTPIIRSVMAFIGTLAYTILAASFMVAIFDIAEEQGANKKVAWGTVFGNFIKAFVFASIIPLACEAMSVLSSDILRLIPIGGYTSTASLSEAMSKMVVGMANIQFIPYIFTLVFLIIGSAAFLVMSMLRFTNLFIHAFVGLLYIANITRGDTSSIGDWLRTAIALSTTYLIQYLMFSIGLTYILDFEIFSANYLFGIAMVLGMFFVPKIMQKFGMSSGVGGAVQQLSSVAIQGFHIMG